MSYGHLSKFIFTMSNRLPILCALFTLSMVASKGLAQNSSHTPDRGNKALLIAENAKSPTTKGSPKDQNFTIVNNSKVGVYFQIFATDKKRAAQKFSSATTVVEASSTIKYNSLAEINWAGPTPRQGATLTYLKASYVNASGDCTADASDYIGSLRVGNKKDRFAKESVIKTDKCGGPGLVKLVWTSANDKVLVTIN